MLLEVGVPPHIVRDIVGHADIGVTMRIYAHTSLDEKREALRKRDERLHKRRCHTGCYTTIMVDRP